MSSLVNMYIYNSTLRFIFVLLCSQNFLYLYINIICTEYKRFGPKKTFRLQRFTREIAKGFLFMYLPLSQKLPVVNCGPCLQITRLFTFYKTVLYLCILHLSHKLRVFNFCLCLQITRLQGISNTFG